MDEKQDVNAAAEEAEDQARGRVRYEDRDLDELRSRMESTKTQMATAYEKIRQRLSLGQVKGQAKGKMTEFGEKAGTMAEEIGGNVKEIGIRLSNTVKSNPLPFAAIGGFAAGFLAWRLIRKPARSPAEGYPEDYDRRMAEMYETQNRESAGSEAGSPGERMSPVSIETIQEHPLIAGLLTFGLGVLVGSLIPETAKEIELMGESSERMKQKARAVGEETLEQAKESASEAYKEIKHTAKEESERQGLLKPEATTEPLSSRPEEESP